MTVIGTVGHIDHGKTSLLQALTGIDADRLPEERERGMTIDVGYAHLGLGNGRTVDFVDLPGHHDLAGNLLVGIGEIDAAMLVIAADEGPQAQTFEHLDILDGYGITEGLVVVTKLDLVDDGARHDVLAVAALLVESSSLRGAPVIGVSARTGEAIDDVREAVAMLDRRVRDRSPLMSAERAAARLAVDRVFRSPGRGLVVTGTLRMSGLTTGDAVRIEPGGGSARVRAIQVHGIQRESVTAGGRVALNLASLGRTTVRRGSVVIRGTAAASSQRMLVTVHLLSARSPAAERELVLHTGTDHVTGGLRWVKEVSGNGPANRAAGLAILTLRRAIAAAPGDRFLLRIPSPPQVYAGGWVLDPIAPVTGTRALRERLPQHDLSVDPAVVLPTLLGYRGVMSRTELGSAAAALGLDMDAPGVLPNAVLVGPIIASRDAVPALNEAALEVARLAGATLGAVRSRVSTVLRRYGGLPPDMIRRAAALVVESLLRDGRLWQIGDLVLEATHDEGAVAQLHEAEARFLDSLASSRPPGLAEAANAAGLPMAAVPGLVSSGRLVRLAPDLAYAAETHADLVALAIGMATRGQLSAAAFRDAAGTSRKNAVVLLDSMSLAGLIRREGAGHVLGPRAASPHSTEPSTELNGDPA